MPQVYRPAAAKQDHGGRTRPALGKRPALQKKAMDLSELLNLNKSSSPAKDVKQTSVETGRAGFLGSERARWRRLGEGRDKVGPSQVGEARDKVEAGREKAVSSPLRKSLLRSSRMGGSLVGGAAEGSSSRWSEVNDHSGAEESQTDGMVEESYASKASDQRQLLRETAAQSSPAKKLQSSHCHRASAYDGNENVDDEYTDDYTDEQTESHNDMNESHDYTNTHGGTDQYDDEPSHSYEEHLNLESPQKIRVRFGDSLNSSLLAPRRVYEPLFGPDAKSATPSTASHPHVFAAQGSQGSPPTITLVSKRGVGGQAQQQQRQSQGIFSCLSTNFWSAVVRPSGPAEILPVPSSAQQQQERREGTHAYSYPPTLAAQIRNRYGVWRNEHPWSMSHMRTLHRMVNSVTSNKSDSIIPKAGPLPHELAELIDTQQTSVAGYEWVFTQQQAQVVEAFRQVLVPRHVVEAMEKGEVERLGDGTARSYRGLIEGRHGDDLVWGPTLGVQRGGISAEFLVKALGDVVAANEGAYRRVV